MLSDGKLVEFDSPQILLSNDHSHFALLVEQTGAAEAEYLRTLANSTGPSTTLRQEICISDEEPASESNETDSLVPSFKGL